MKMYVTNSRMTSLFPYSTFVFAENPEMCVDCVKQEFPDRESVCLDNGSYLMNYAGCCKCGERESIKIVNRQESNDEDEEHEELITFQHICSSCDHQIANHEHLFRIEGDYQIYEMQCLLCGHGDDQRSIMPFDPRGPKD